LISKRFSKKPRFTWREGLVLFVCLCGCTLLFCLTCKPQAQAISKFSARLHLGEPAAALAQSLPDVIPRLSQKTTILLMGVDSNGLTADPFLNTRSDTMMLVSIDPQSSKVAVVSIPRDSRVTIPDHGTDKINSAHALGGPELSMRTVREAFGVPVDHYIEVDTGGLKKLFEILGPVEVLVEKEMRYVDHSAKLTVDLQSGLQQLTPAQAEEYVRFRNDGRGDIGRIERQQWFVRQAARKLKDPEIVLKLPQLVYLAYQCVHTDLPVQDVLAIAGYARDFPHEKVVTAMLPGEARMIGGGSYWVCDPVADQVLFSRLLGIQPLQNLASDVPQAPDLWQHEARSAFENAAPGTEPTKPPTVAIKYPAGCERLSEAIADQLSLFGFRVKYRYQIATCDCRHEMLLLQSLRAGDETEARICQAIPEMQNFPRSFALESRPATDFTIIISPETLMPSICRSQLSPATLQAKAPPLNVSACAVPLLPQE
jgi:LCP family protein required for cell wall assembly